MTFARAVKIMRSRNKGLAALGEHYLSVTIKIWINNYHIATQFTPRPFQGDLLLFASTVDQPEDVSTSDTWRAYVDGKIETRPIVSRHDNMMTEPGPIAQIGSILAAKLQEISTGTAPTCDPKISSTP